MRIVPTSLGVVLAFSAAFAAARGAACPPAGVVTPCAEPVPPALYTGPMPPPLARASFGERRASAGSRSRPFPTYRPGVKTP
ncbi:hypothetical protein JCM13210_13880 [Thermaerobacter litoralis]